jgi:hypothetical protein
VSDYAGNEIKIVGVAMPMTREEFVAYLRETLIPDLRRSGWNNTASDFEAAVLFIQGSREVEIEELGVVEIN